MHLPRTLIAAAAAVALLTAACGNDDNATGAGGGADRTVEIAMVDIAYEPGNIEVAAGETVRFVFTNDGKLPHDAFIGDSAAQADHEQQMRDADNGSMNNGSMNNGSMNNGSMNNGSMNNGVTVKPGDTAELTYTFDKAGTIEIGCHQPGHYAAGMKITVKVT